MDNIIVRPYRDLDRDSIRDIAFNTAFFGSSAEIFFDGKDVFADFLTSYFTDCEPESCFVAEKDSKVVGYIIGAKDSQKMEKIFLCKILPRLLFKVVVKSIWRKKNIRFIFNCIKSFLNKEFNDPDFSKEYPAVLHINLNGSVRGLGVGGRLMTAYLDYLAGKNVLAVRLATTSDQAREFFIKQGFKLLHIAQRSYFRSILGKDISVYIMGRKI